MALSRRSVRRSGFSRSPGERHALGAGGRHRNGGPDGIYDRNIGGCLSRYGTAQTNQRALIA